MKRHYTQILPMTYATFLTESISYVSKDMDPKEEYLTYLQNIRDISFYSPFQSLEEWFNHYTKE